MLSSTANSSVRTALIVCGMLAGGLMGCASQDPQTSEGADSTGGTGGGLGGKADNANGDPNVWIGLPSYTIERYAPDPCNDGASVLDANPIIYGSWARERAGVRNVCYEAYLAGVTDWDDPGFWQKLNAQVHYWYTGDEENVQQAYVNSIDRRGNNSRYAWPLTLNLDPLFAATSITSIKAPFKILSEDDGTVTSVEDGWAQVSAELNFYFTVNGNPLRAPSGDPFVVRYEGYVSKPHLPVQEGGYVLGDIVTCQDGALRVGWGAGNFFADVRDPAAVANLGAGLDGSFIYGGRVSVSGSGSEQILSVRFTSQMNGSDLPEFSDSYYNPPASAEILAESDSSMSLVLQVYDRATGEVRALTQTFNDCVKAPE